MGTIQLEESAVQCSATRIANTTSNLNSSKSVSFSSGTTVQGNQTTKKDLGQLKKQVKAIQKALRQDSNNIQTVVSTFKKSDLSASILFD